MAIVLRETSWGDGALLVRTETLEGVGFDRVPPTPRYRVRVAWHQAVLEAFGDAPFVLEPKFAQTPTLARCFHDSFVEGIEAFLLDVASGAIDAPFILVGPLPMPPPLRRLA